MNSDNNKPVSAHPKFKELVDDLGIREQLDSEKGYGDIPEGQLPRGLAPWFSDLIYIKSERNGSWLITFSLFTS